MGIANVIEFGGVSSDLYDVIIEGPGEYTAPKRAYESVSIPGRNGAFVLDKGYYENVDGKFKAVIQAATQLEFQQKIREFKNAIVSQLGYQRLTEQYQPETYRLAAYKSGLDEEPEFIGKAAIFTLIFDCKPQRFLMSGEIAMPVTSGDIIYNPTPFEASPMLEVEGYGEITISGGKLEVQNAELGETKLSSPTETSSVELNVDNLNAGDAIISKSNTEPYVDITIKATSPISYYGASMQSDYDREHGSVVVSGISANSYKIRIIPKISGIVKGTDSSMTIRCISYLQPGSTSYSNLFDVTVAYTASTNTISLSASCPSSSLSPSGTTASYQYKQPAYYGDSSKSVLPDVMYIDLDIGEAYGELNGVMTSMNNIVSLPAELPKLASGNNEITFDNTITDLKIVPGWWEV